MNAKNFRRLSKDNVYSLERIEEEILAPSNLRFKRDDAGSIADVSSNRAGKEGSLALEVTAPESYSPEILMQALDRSEAAEKEFMRTGKREMSINESPGMNNIDFERAVIITNLLDGPSLELLASRGMHGKSAGNRMAKVDAVANLLYKGTYGRDPYTNSPILGVAQDQGHLESNSRGGVRLRPEVALINQWLTDTEGLERLERIRQARIRMNAAKNFDASILNSPEIANLMRYKDFQSMVNKQERRKSEYGYI